MSSLPLRLIVEPLIRQLLGSAFVLPSCQESKICFVVNDSGLVCLVQDQMYSNEFITSVLGLDNVEIPEYILVADTQNKWYKKGRACGTPNKADLLSRTVSPNSVIAKIIVEGIERYYGRQVLEPSIRGFLSILEKQFPRNDLYLFELLQNAVDDGANHVIFKAFKDGSIEKGLSFCHNGRGFTALDVLGLASVGLSTKGADGGNKRTIGFMGVGFKAVYKRFRRVVIHDHIWRFVFEEPKRPSGTSSAHTMSVVEPEHAWVMKPHWVSDSQVLWDGQSRSPRSEWCHFQLELPRVAAVESSSNLSISNIRTTNYQDSLTISNELRFLPDTIPPLLGRQAISKERERLGAASSTAAPGLSGTSSVLTLY